MSPRTRFFLAGTFLLIVFKACVPSSVHAQEKEASTAKIFGDVSLMSDYIDHGLTQTEHSFALQTGIGYRWPAFRMGLWGTNVKYPSGDDNLNLRLYLSTRLNFTNDVDMLIRYDFNRYYKSGDRNGGILGLDLRFYEYHILYESNDNWEGLKAAGARIGFLKEWPLSYNNTSVTLNAGYNMLSVDGLSNYFDFKTLLNYKGSDLIYSFGNNYNSNSGQFGGRGDLAFFVQIAAKF